MSNNANLTVLYKDRTTIEAIITSDPATEVIDVLRKRLVVAWQINGSSKPFLHLTLEFLKAHIVYCVLETNIFVR